MTAAFGVTVADQQVAARHLFQEKGEVLAPCQRLALAGHAIWAQQFFGHITGEIGLVRAVDQHGVAALVVHMGPNAVALGLTVIAVAAATVLLGMAWEGRLSSGWLWQRWAVLIAVALTGVWLGHRMAHHVSVARLRQMICVLLVLSGVMLALGALR